MQFKRMTAHDQKYVLRLARQEIKINPQRLGEHRTRIIYHEGKRIGFVSYRPQDDGHVYIYMLAFVKNAQRQGYAPRVLAWLEHKARQRLHLFQGITVTIHSNNDQARAAAQKHGFALTAQRRKYVDYFRKAPTPSTEQQG